MFNGSIVLMVWKANSQRLFRLLHLPELAYVSLFAHANIVMFSFIQLA